MLEEKITNIKRNLIEYAGLVENMIDKALQGLLERELQPLNEVIEKDEVRSNKFELEIDEMCLATIAQFQPKARDLRTILMVLRINNDLERIADHAVNIAESSAFLIERPVLKPLIDIPRMSQISVRMLKDSINAFINEDVELAYDVCMRDSGVDNLRDQILRELIMFMSSSPTTIERAFQLIRISSNLERIADLSTNISEDIIFMVQGKVVKHYAEEGSDRIKE
ncbi:TPA: phosphate signaling complex protein PhoU [Candidatus Poribacteria bacterium]|nr:phosphate signaling complex protein PhoU [Candidatus Poribacteria bacterium]